MTPSIWQLLIVILFLGFPFILGTIFIRKNEYSALSENQKYAGFWYRLLAGIIDSIILLISSFVLFVIIFKIAGTNRIESILIADVGSPFIAFFYFVLFQSSSKQATPGMMALNIKIYDEQFKRVGFWKLTLRYITTYWSALFLFIGFFMIGWTKRKQGFHDLVARTIHLKE